MQEGQPFREVKDMAEELVRMGFARYEKEVKEKVEVSHQEKAEGEPIKRKKTK